MWCDVSTFEMLVAALHEELGDPTGAMVFVSFTKFVVSVGEELFRYDQVSHYNIQNHM